MGPQELEPDPNEQSDGGKRRLELANQKPQEIGAPAAESKRPRIVINFPVNKPLPFPVPPVSESNQNPVSNKKITIAEGKGGETVKQIELQSGANVRIAQDHEADLGNLTRDMDLMGTSEQISRAEELINAVIHQESDAVPSTEGKQRTEEVKIPSDKVGLLIGTGGETVKYIQKKSGADILVIPLHPGEQSTERTLYINGTAKQIETAKELVNDVIHKKPPASSGYDPPRSGHQTTDVWCYGQTRYLTAQMTGHGYYEQRPQMGSAPGPHGQPDGPVSSQSTEPVPAYPPFWFGEGADPPPSWQTDSGYDPTVHWWEQAESQQPSKKGQSRSPATRPETRDEDS